MDARRAIGELSYFLHESIGIALTLFFLFSLLRALLKKQWLASAAFILLFAGNIMLENAHPAISGTFTAMQGALAIYTVIRFGVLPMVVGIFASSLLPEFPVTMDFSQLARRQRLCLGHGVGIGRVVVPHCTRRTATVPGRLSSITE